MTVARVARLLTAAAVAIVLAVGLAALFADAATATTRAYDYDATDAPTASCVVAASPAARPGQAAASWSVAASTYGYDDLSNLARTSARPVEGVLAPNTPGCGGQVLYHYTSAEGMAGILACQCINGSTGSTNARHGDGAYFTDLAPEGVTGTTAGQLSRALYGVPWNASRVSHFVAVDSSMVVPPPVWVAPLNSNTYPGSIYLSPSTVAVSIAGAVRRSGAVPF